MSRSKAWAGWSGVLFLFALSSCTTAPLPTETTSTAPVSTATTPGKETAPCHGAYLSEFDTSVPGEATPEAAAVAWSKSALAPSGAPTDGWTAIDDRTLGSGDWIVRVVHFSPDGWHVDGLGCGAAPCHGAYVADVDTRVPGVDINIPGEPTPEAAAVAWAKSVIAPSGAPTDGWKAIDEQTVRSGDWIVGVTRTVTGGWVVSGLRCARDG